MSVPVDVSFDNFVGTGAQTAFNTTFPFEKSTDLTVTVAGVTKVLGVDYNVTGGGFLTGTVTFGAAPAAAAAVVITRDVAFVQPTGFRSQGPFSPESYEKAVDRLTYQTQELERRILAIEAGANTNNAVAGDGLQNVAGTWKVKPDANGGNPNIQVSAAGVKAATDGDENHLAPVLSDHTTPSAGGNELPARVDHQHVAQTAAPGNAGIGDAAAIGASDSLARADHTHGWPAPGAPANVTKAAAQAGVSTKPAREDHKHDVTTAPAVDLTDAASTEGVATTLTRSDHTHAHGNRGGGPLHAEVTTVADGFMIASDKAKLDAITEFANTLVQTVSSSVTTVDATATPVGVLATAINGEGYYVDAIVIALKTDASQAAAYRLQAIYRKAAGTLTLVGAVQQVFVQEDDAAWDATLIISGGNVRAQVTGKAATNITWKIYSRAYQCP
jgi:hypothetical protein